LGLGGFGNVSTDGDGFTTGCGDGGDDFFRAGFTGSVIYDDGCAFGCEGFGDGGTDAFGGAGYHCDFTFELAHL